MKASYCKNTFTGIKYKLFAARRECKKLENKNNDSPLILHQNASQNGPLKIYRFERAGKISMLSFSVFFAS